MKALQLLFAFLPLAVSAQRIVPVDVVIDGVNAEVKAMAEFNGKLIIGGKFTGISGQPAPNIAAWDGAGGVDDMGMPILGGPVEAIVPFAGGVAFSGSPFPQYRSVFFWDGDTTTIIGTPGNGRVSTLMVFDNTLYAGGSFTSIDGVSVDRIARWDGNTWSALEAGLNDLVYCLAVYDGQLYVGGKFTATADGVTALVHMARWDGTAFQQVGTGLDRPVRDLVPTNEGLWIAGDFGFSGDSAMVLDRFAAWNGGQFAPLLAQLAATGLGSGSLVTMGDYGVLARVYGSYDLVYRDGVWTKAWLRGIDCGQQFQGATLVGGRMEFNFLDTLQAIGKLLPGSGHLEIEVAGIRAWVRSDGYLCYDHEVGRPDFVPVAEGGASSIFAHVHYVVAYLGDSAFTSSFAPYANTNEYRQGPRCIDRNTTFTDRYQRTWPIDIGMLWDHAANWMEPGYTPPNALLESPVSGDIGNGEPAQVADFQENDGDGLYEPELGELPVIKGDKAVLVAVSDQAADGLPDIYPSMFDTQLLVHGYDSGPEVLDQTLFVTYMFTNRSDRMYDSVVVAMHTDADVGCADDDYIGCDPDLDMFYTYNWDESDEGCNGSLGFGAHPPAQGVVGLSAPMRSFIYFGRDGPSNMNDPSTTLHAAHYAEGVWKDGSPQINPVTNLPTSFMYSDYPDVPGGFHENQQTNPDRRGTASFGPYYNVAPGDRICFDMALVFARDTTQDNIQNTRVLQQKVIALKDWYAQQPHGCGSYAPVAVPQRVAVSDVLSIRPNPARALAWLHRVSTEKDAQVRVFSPRGEVLRTEVWKAGAPDLPLSLEGLAAGVYSVRMVDERAQRTVRLVVVH